VTSKNNDDEQHIWTSTADSKFSIVKDPRGDTLGRGTRVTLHLKDDALEYVEQDKIKNLVKRYSEFINYPIRLFTSKDVQKEVPDETAEPAKEGVTKLEGDDIKENKDKPADEPKGDEEKDADGKDKKKDDGVEVKDEGENKDEAKPKMKTITEQEWSWEHINEIKAIWMREKKDITEEMYQSFYKTITKDADNPLSYAHFSAEVDDDEDEKKEESKGDAPEADAVGSEEPKGDEESAKKDDVAAPADSEKAADASADSGKNKND